MTQTVSNAVPMDTSSLQDKGDTRGRAASTHTLS